MAKVLVTDTYLSDIGDAIRGKLDVETTYKPSEMANAIESIETYPEPTGTKTITANGTGIDVKDYASADVNVPNSYSASDEGKVVSNGALVAQGSQTITENGTYDTTLIDEAVVNVSGGGGGLPSGYTRVEYIRANAAADEDYINTGVVPTSNTKVFATCLYHENCGRDQGGASLFGCRTALNNKMFNYMQNPANLFLDFGNNRLSQRDAVTLSERSQIIKFNKDGFAVNSDSYSPTVSAFTAEYQLYLFAQNNAGSAITFARASLYSMRIYEGNALIRDFVPCVRDSDDEVGLYDLVGGTFYTNSGAGTLVAGDELRAKA